MHDGAERVATVKFTFESRHDVKKAYMVSLKLLKATPEAKMNVRGPSIVYSVLSGQWDSAG